jgi:hypothetical protein
MKSITHDQPIRYAAEQKRMPDFEYLMSDILFYFVIVCFLALHAKKHTTVLLSPSHNAQQQ